MQIRFKLTPLSVIAALVLVSLTPAIAADTLVPLGSTWKYLDDGSDQGTAWQSPTFDDSTWASGPAQLGYGDGDEATVVFNGVIIGCPEFPDPDPTCPAFATTYFRHTFNVADPSIYVGLNVGLIRDDGAVVYLNGIEVFRSNMPAGPIDYLTLAASTINMLEEITLDLKTLDPAVLVAGSNVLAVEVHQRNLDSSDISMDLELIGITVPPAILKLSTTVVAQGSTDLAELELTLSHTQSGGLNGFSFGLVHDPALAYSELELATTVGGIAVSAPVVTPGAGAVTAEAAFASPLPPGTYTIATARYESQLVAAGDIATVEFAEVGAPVVPIEVEGATGPLVPVTLTGAVFADGGNDSELYFLEPDDDNVRRLRFNDAGAVLGIASIPASPVEARGVAVDANGIAWITASTGSTVHRYRSVGDTVTPIDTITVGSFPEAIAFGPDGSAWIGNRGDSGNVTKVSAAGQVLLGPGGALGPALIVPGIPIDIAVDRFGTVWVLTEDEVEDENGTICKISAAGNPILEILYTSLQDPVDIAVDRAGYVWVALATGPVQIRASDGSLDAELAAGLFGADAAYIAIRSTPAAELVPQLREAWVAADLGSTITVKRIRRSGLISTVDLTGVCGVTPPSDVSGISIDGNGRVWVTVPYTPGCAFSIDPTIAPLLVDDVLTTFEDSVRSFGDASGYRQSNVQFPAGGGPYFDLDNDTVQNSAELSTGSNPFLANSIVVPPVTGLTCTAIDTGSSLDIQIDWANGTVYDSIKIVVNADLPGATILGGAVTTTTIIDPGPGVYFIEVRGESGGVQSAPTACQIVLGPGGIQQQLQVGLSILDITSTDLAPPDPAFYVTDIGTESILALDASYNIIANLGNPFAEATPFGIAYDPPAGGTTFGPTIGSLYLSGHEPGVGVRIKRVDLNGQSITTEALAFNGLGQPLDGDQPPGGMALDRNSGTLLMAGPSGCLLFAFDVGQLSFTGPTTITSFLEFSHPFPGSSLNGIEVANFDATGGEAWIPQDPDEDGAFEIQKIAVSPTGTVTPLLDPIPLGAISDENSFGGFAFSLAGAGTTEVNVVGITTSSVYAIEGPALAGPPQYIRGDGNTDGGTDIGDAINMLGYLFTSGPATCLAALDANDDGSVDIGDPIALLAYLFSGAGPLAEPFGACGVDPTPDTLTCDSFPPCP